MRALPGSALVLHMGSEDAINFNHATGLGERAFLVLGANSTRLEPRGLSVHSLVGLASVLGEGRRRCAHCIEVRLGCHGGLATRTKNVYLFTVISAILNVSTKPTINSFNFAGFGG